MSELIELPQSSLGCQVDGHIVLRVFCFSNVYVNVRINIYILAMLMDTVRALSWFGVQCVLLLYSFELVYFHNLHNVSISRHIVITFKIVIKHAMHGHTCILC